MYIPEELQGDVAKFFASKAGNAYLQVLKQRLPLAPDFSEALHSIACKYAFREGYERMLVEAENCWREQDPSPSRIIPAISSDKRTDTSDKPQEIDVSQLSHEQVNAILLNPHD